MQVDLRDDEYNIQIQLRVWLTTCGVSSPRCEPYPSTFWFILFCLDGSGIKHLQGNAAKLQNKM